MKKLITILLTILITLTSFGQVVDFKNIDFDHLDSLLLVAVNDYRDSIGSTKLVPSKVLRDEFSKSQTERINLRGVVCHPDGDDHLISLHEMLEYELMMGHTTHTSGYFGEPEYVAKTVGGKTTYTTGEHYVYAEVVSRTTYVNRKSYTYSDIVNTILNSWLSSPGHKNILDNVSSGEKVGGASSCTDFVSVKLTGLNPYFHHLICSLQIVPLR